jgi:hypothetical protein
MVLNLSETYPTRGDNETKARKPSGFRAFVYTVGTAGFEPATP